MWIKPFFTSLLSNDCVLENTVHAKTLTFEINLYLRIFWVAKFCVCFIVTLLLCCYQALANLTIQELGYKSFS